VKRPYTYPTHRQSRLEAERPADECSHPGERREPPDWEPRAKDFTREGALARCAVSANPIQSPP